MATYGEGDPTDNAQDFYDWLQETDVDLTGVKFAVSFPESFGHTLASGSSPDLGSSYASCPICSFTILRDRGSYPYFSEAFALLEHLLQCCQLQ